MELREFGSDQRKTFFLCGDIWGQSKFFSSKFNADLPVVKCVHLTINEAVKIICHWQRRQLKCHRSTDRVVAVK